MSWPLYQSIKQVEGLKIKAIHFRDSGYFIIPEEDHDPVDVTCEWMAKHQPHVGGYLVRYVDGYMSYSPRIAFENGNVPIRDVPRVNPMLNFLEGKWIVKETVQ